MKISVIRLSKVDKPKSKLLASATVRFEWEEDGANLFMSISNWKLFEGDESMYIRVPQTSYMDMNKQWKNEDPHVYPCKDVIKKITELIIAKYNEEEVINDDLAEKETNNDVMGEFMS